MAYIQNWQDRIIKQDEIEKYLINGKDFIDENKIKTHLETNKNPDKNKIRDIIQKAISIERLEPNEVAF